MSAASREVSSVLKLRTRFAEWSTEMDKLEIVKEIAEAEGAWKKAIDAARTLLSLGVAPDRLRRKCH